MQFFILLIGVMVFVFYLFHPAPVHWNAANVEAMQAGSVGATYMSPAKDRTNAEAIAAMHAKNAELVAANARAWVEAERLGPVTDNEQRATDLRTALERDNALRSEYATQVKARLPDAEPNDKDYIFISFIMDHMPVGVVGLLLAMIFCAGMGSTSSQLSALATTAVVDILRTEGTGAQQVRATRLATVVFGLLALSFAAVFSLFENLIQAVNILGSLFYGTILGIFLVAFFLKRVQGTAVFVAALVAEAAILYLHFAGIEVAFLWYNLIAPAIVVVLALGIQVALPRVRTPGTP
jgi:hypothetical protein